VVKCAKILNNVLQIVDEDTTMAWQRYRATHNVKKPREKSSTITGCTALGMLAFQIMDDRTSRDKKYGRNRVSAFHQTHFVQGNMLTVALTTIAKQQKAFEEENAKKNRDVMAYFQKEFILYLFAKMLPQMRLALRMGSHSRLGGHNECLVGKLNPDIMNMIFNALVRDITTLPSVLNVCCARLICYAGRNTIMHYHLLFSNLISALS